MQYLLKSGSPEKQRSGCVIVGVFDRRKPSPAAQIVDTASGGAVDAAMRRGDMDGQLGSTLLLQGTDGIAADRVLLVGLGKQKDFNERNFVKAVESAVRAVKKTGATDASNYLTQVAPKGRDARWSVLRAALAAANLDYRFDQCKSEPAKDRSRLARHAFHVADDADAAAARAALKQANATIAGMSLTRDLGNLPGNRCTPTTLADTGRKLAEQYPAIKTKVLNEKQMEKLGMGALLSVSRGSREPATFTVMEYMQGRKKDKPIVLVGKGLTFDAGGISLKPAQAMDEMKYDMSGGGAVFGAMKAVAELGLKVNLVGIVPASENLPDGLANKPGDIVTSMSGITIEILNTDAEGRLLLCDALTYVERHYEPEAVIDMATLTGAMVVALGSHASGLFSNQPTLARALLDAGQTTGDRAWEMPMWEDYQSQLNSPFADVQNIGGRDAGAVTAACFLHRFARKLRWAHMDIAGSAWTQKPKGATGRPVPLLVEYLAQQASGR